jgi:hypothetical protein
MKMRPVGAALFLEDGRTDVTKRIVALRNFTNAPRNGRPLSCAQNTLYFGRLWPSTLPFAYSCDFYRPPSYKASWNLTDRFNFTEERFDSTHAAESTPAKKPPHRFFKGCPTLVLPLHFCVDLDWRLLYQRFKRGTVCLKSSCGCTSEKLSVI